MGEFLYDRGSSASTAASTAKPTFETSHEVFFIPQPEQEPSEVISQGEGTIFDIQKVEPEDVAITTDEDRVDELLRGLDIDQKDFVRRSYHNIEASRESCLPLVPYSPMCTLIPETEIEILQDLHSLEWGTALSEVNTQKTSTNGPEVQRSSPAVIVSTDERVLSTPYTAVSGDSESSADSISASLLLAEKFVAGSRSPIDKGILALGGLVKAEKLLKQKFNRFILGRYDGGIRKDARAIAHGINDDKKPSKITSNPDHRRFLKASIIVAAQDDEACEAIAKEAKLPNPVVIDSSAEKDIDRTEVASKRRHPKRIVVGLGVAGLAALLIAPAIASEKEPAKHQTVDASTAMAHEQTATTIAPLPTTIVEEIAPTTTVAAPPATAEATATPAPAAAPAAKAGSRTPTTKKKTTATASPAAVTITTPSTRTIFPNPGDPCPPGTRKVEKGEVPTKDDRTPRYAGQCIPRIGQ